MAKAKPEESSLDRCELLTTGDMARLSESTLRTVRFYEEAGLLEPVRRSTGAHRLFHRRELSKLRLALDLREGGLSVQDVKSLFCLKADCTSPEEASQRMSTVLNEKIECMQKKIAKLHQLRKELSEMIAAISECETCEDRSFPLGCGKCDTIDTPKISRALRVLWQEKTG